MPYFDVVAQLTIQADSVIEAARLAALEYLRNPKCVVLVGERNPQDPPMAHLTHLVRLSDLAAKELDKPIHGANGATQASAIDFFDGSEAKQKRDETPDWEEGNR